MSAPNFAKNNAEDYYCVGMNREEDEWIDWDEMREDIFQVAKAESDFWAKDDSWEHGYGRDYQLHHAAERSYSMTYGGESYFAKVQIGIRSAYFEGGNIDYNIELEDEWYDGYYLQDGDTNYLALCLINDKYQDGNHAINKGLATMHRKGLEKRLTEWLNGIVADCEKIAQTCAEEQLVKTAQFSNGEAIYERKTPRTELKAALLEVV